MPEDDKVRAAGVRQEQRLTAGMDTAGVVKAVKTARETDSTFRVYCREWIHEGYFDDDHAALDFAARKWGGRVRETDLRVLPPDAFSKRPALEVRLWNVKAEIKRAETAQRYKEDFIDAGVPADDVEVVARNSRREHELNQYGILKLT